MLRRVAILNNASVPSASCTRSASIYRFIRPKPRPYRRRLYEEVMKEQFPKELAKEKERLVENDPYVLHPVLPQGPDVYDQYDLAEVEMVKNWIKTEGFRVLGICQVYHVEGRDYWLASNQFRTKGLEIKKFRGKTMRKLFQGTRFDALSTLFDDNTYVLYGKDPETLRQVVIGTDKYNWITLLAATLDDQIIPMNLLGRIVRYKSISELGRDTFQLLQRVPHELLNNLSSPALGFTNTLDHMSREQNTEGEAEKSELEKTEPEKAE
ncbi:Mitochondrial Ribosomal Protein, Large [Ditylenchus destructor]|uniref:Large ribosomal subunit protein uL10m n=1 Tax=Ditylenchus destructor TaxID=166010 RepID=A0AAD4N9B8_9BILA|nr:Mitochondrial Ribosomal Protein, Large [Ditylenchus destructor]